MLPSVNKYFKNRRLDKLVTKKCKKGNKLMTIILSMYKRNMDDCLMSLALPKNCIQCNYVLCYCSWCSPDIEQKAHKIHG